MEKKLFISGQRIDLNQEISKVEQDITDAIGKYFNGHVIHYSEEKNTAKIVIDRGAQYYITGDWLIDTDCSMLTGLEDIMFGVDPIGIVKKEYEAKGITIPIVQPVIPYASHYYIGGKEFCHFFKNLNEEATKCNIKSMKAFGSNNMLSLTVKFSDKE